MFHTERDVATFLAEMLLFVATGAGAVVAMGVLIALDFKVFKSRRALSVVFLLSTIAFVPLLAALILQWPYLPGEWDMNPITGVLSLFDGVLMFFVWASPVIQYGFVRRGAADQTQNPIENRPAS